MRELNFDFDRELVENGERGVILAREELVKINKQLADAEHRLKELEERAAQILKNKSEEDDGWLETMTELERQLTETRRMRANLEDLKNICIDIITGFQAREDKLEQMLRNWHAHQNMPN